MTHGRAGKYSFTALILKGPILHLMDLRDMMSMACCLIPQDPISCPVGSMSLGLRVTGQMLFWQHNQDIHNKQVLLILWLICGHMHAFEHRCVAMETTDSDWGTLNRMSQCNILHIYINITSIMHERGTFFICHIEKL